MNSVLREARYQTVGKRMGEAISAHLDFQIFWLLHHGVYNSCIRCGREYKGKTRGWLIRHYRITGHWREAT